jgi:hypothetical protein
MSEPSPTLTRLQAVLDRNLEHSSRAVRDMYASVATDLEAAMVRLRLAERRATEAEERAETLRLHLERAISRAAHAEQEISAVRASATWKVGRVFVALPGRVRRLVKSRPG